MCVKLNSLFDKEMKIYYMLQVFKQSIKRMCPYYILKFRNTQSHLWQIYLGV